VRRCGALAVVALVAGISCVTPVDVQGAAACPVPDVVALQSLVNSFRSTNQRRALPLSAELNRKAQSWAEHMASSGDFRHGSLTTGVSSGWTGLAENIAYTSGDLASAQASLQASPLHRRNLLDGSWSEMGLGVARASSGRIYVTQEFAARPTPTASSVPAFGATAFRAITPRSVYRASIAAGSVRRFRVAGTTGVSPSVRAVVVSLTATAASGSTLRLVPSGASAVGPAMATVIDGRVATTVLVPLASDGTLGVVSTAAAAVQVVVLGVFIPAPQPVSAGRLVPVVSASVLDADVPAGLSVVQVAGVGSVPAAGVGPVVVQVRATGALARGVVQVGLPTMAAGGWTSLTVPRGRNSTTLTVSNLDALGRIAVRASTAMHLRLDVRGWFTTSTARASRSGLFVPIATTRVFDSRRLGAPSAGSNRINTRSVGALPQCSSGVAGTLAVLTGAGSNSQIGPTTGFVDSDDRATIDDGTGSTQRVTVVSGTGGTDSVTVRRVDTSQAVLDLTGWFV
jgi:hypothetical protein